MSWQTEMVTLLRVMIADWDVPYKYSDQRLELVIVSSAQMVMVDSRGKFSKSYISDFTIPTITPDPTDRINGTRDDSFINLTLIKSACFIDSAAAREASRRGGILLREFGSSIDTRGVVNNAILVWEQGWCKQYDKEIFSYLANNSSSCAAILSPFRILSNAYKNGSFSNDSRR